MKSDGGGDGCGDSAQETSRVLAARTAAALASGRGDLWDSGKVGTSDSVNVVYNGAKLRSGAVCHWKVMVWDTEGKPTAWSTPARFSVGLLAASDWKAQWVGMASAAETDCPWIRKTFVLTETPETALAYVGSIGFHELYVNGRKVGDRLLAPSVSDLQKRALYVTYDLAPYLRVGKNAVVLWLSPGWALFRDGNPNVDFHVAKKPLGIAQIQWGRAEGPFMEIATDATWRCAQSTTTHLGKWQNSDFGGDRVDLAKETPGWNDITLDDHDWEPASVYAPGLTLSPDLVEPNRRCDAIPAAKVEQIAPHKVRFTMAKLFSGIVEFKLKGAPGSKVTLMACSHPHADCEYNQLDQVLLAPSGVGAFANRFSYHEAKYVTVEGLDYLPASADLTGYRVSNDRKRIGDFDCSNTLLKRIYDTTVNTYVNLSTGGMTVDCPHRERLGYGGDGHTSLELALDTFESDAFFSKWAQDWCDIQQPNGDIYHTAPTMGGGGGPGWSGFVIFMPWEVYQATADRRILEKTYPTARKWLAFLEAHIGADGLLNPLPGGAWYFLGDWAGPHGSEGSDSQEALLFNNCYYLIISRLAAQIARVLGKLTDSAQHLATVAKLSQAINARFLHPADNVYLDSRQTHLVMPLVAGAVPPDRIDAVLKNLEHEILVAQQGHLDTGLHGTFFLTKYLTEAERSDLIYAYASQTTAPSYGDLLARGLETWPEYWTGADSLVHGCLNGIGGWFQRGLAGIRPDPAAPGYRRIIIKPAIVGDLTWVRAHHDSPYGRIVSAWRRDGDRFTLEVVIPPNTTATIYLPAQDPSAVTESGRPGAQAEGVRLLKRIPGCCVFLVESGDYRFSSRVAPAL
jgi:alpha-L-rhamnosidase